MFPPTPIPSPQLLQFRQREGRVHASNQASRREFSPSSIFKEEGFERRNTLMLPFCPLPRKLGEKQWKKCVGWVSASFYLPGSVQRRGIPPAEPIVRSNKSFQIRKELYPRREKIEARLRCTLPRTGAPLPHRPCMGFLLPWHSPWPGGCVGLGSRGWLAPARTPSGSMPPESK